MELSDKEGKAFRVLAASLWHHSPPGDDSHIPQAGINTKPSTPKPPVQCRQFNAPHPHHQLPLSSRRPSAPGHPRHQSPRRHTQEAPTTSTTVPTLRAHDLEGLPFHSGT